MNLVNLETFLTIIETGSLIRASDRLNVTQSTVTARLKTLEDELGQELLVRQKSGSTLTPHGIKFRRYAEVMVALWKQAGRDISLPKGIEALCNIGCHSDLRPKLGQALLDTIRDANPQVALSAWAGSTADLTTWLNEGLVDLALTYHSAPQSGLRFYTLDDEALILVSTKPNSPMRFDPNYVFVEGGEEFGREHAEYYSDANTAQLNFGSAIWALDHILLNGGSAYLPERLVSEYLETGLLFPIVRAPKFRRKTYLAVNEKAAGPWLWLPEVIDNIMK